MTLTIVSRREHVGAPADRRNRAWLHDGRRWRRPERLSIDVSRPMHDVQMDSYVALSPGEWSTSVEIDGAVLQRCKGFDAAQRRDVLVWRVAQADDRG